MVGIPDAWVIPMMLTMYFLMEGLGDSEGGNRNIVRWSTYMEELDSSNSLSLELMLSEDGSAGKEVRSTLPMRNLVFDGTGSSYIVPTVFSFVSFKGEKNEGEPWNW